eukprot:COSAG05_NODE_446_length_9772_cov_117.012923_12_plen_84_part_00
MFLSQTVFVKRAQIVATDVCVAQTVTVIVVVDGRTCNGVVISKLDIFGIFGNLKIWPNFEVAQVSALLDTVAPARARSARSAP